MARKTEPTRLVIKGNAARRAKPASLTANQQSWPDKGHLEGDAERVFRRLATEWLLYCRHLKHRYPYIFSIIVRTHPLQPNPSATVE